MYHSVSYQTAEPLSAFEATVPAAAKKKNGNGGGGVERIADSYMYGGEIGDHYLLVAVACVQLWEKVVSQLQQYHILFVLISCRLIIC